MPLKPYHADARGKQMPVAREHDCTEAIYECTFIHLGCNSSVTDEQRQREECRDLPSQGFPGRVRIKTKAVLGHVMNHAGFFDI